MRFRSSACLACLLCVAVLVLADPGSPASQPATRPVRTATSGMFLAHLVVHPAALPATPMKYTFATFAVDTKPGNAALLYHMAALQVPRNAMLPPLAPVTNGSAKPAQATDTIGSRMDEYLDAPTAELSGLEAHRFVEYVAPSLELIDRAAACQDCQWEFPLPPPTVGPKMNIGAELDTLSNMRFLLDLLSVRTRVEVADKRYDDAARSLCSAFAMSSNLCRGQGSLPTTVALQLSSRTLPCFEEFEQAPGSPNCYWALAALPHPFVDMRSALQNDATIAQATFSHSTHSQWGTYAEYNEAWGQLYSAFLLPSYRQTLAALNHVADQHPQQEGMVGSMWQGLYWTTVDAGRLDRNIAIYQCIEAIRAYAADHHGGLPPTLDDLTDAPAPPCPLTGTPFIYKVSGQSFTLDTPPLAGWPQRFSGPVSVTMLPN